MEYEKRRTKTNRRAPLPRVSVQAARGGGTDPQLSSREAKKISYNILSPEERGSKSALLYRHSYAVGVETPTYNSYSPLWGRKKEGADNIQPLTPTHRRGRKAAFTLAEVFHPAGKSRKIAFTLAEVLITLGIIGIVAALTMPSMITNYQRKQAVVGLKKAYNVMSNAFRNAENEFGPIETWDDVWSGTYQNNHIAFVDKYLKPSLKNYEYRLRKGQISTVLGNNNKWFYLDDGTCFMMHVPGSGYFSYIYYDINGNAKPNVMGRDIFLFTFNYQHYYKFTPFVSEWYRNGGAKLPISKGIRDWLLVQNTQGGCNKNSDNRSCAAVIMYDGWQISSDYPW